jgi:hypothetical protein
MGVDLAWHYAAAALDVAVDSVSFGDELIGQNEATVMSEIASAIQGIE